MEKYIEVDDRRYYYRDGGTYTETGEFVPEGEALVLHFRATGRTPLVKAFTTQQFTEEDFRRFHLFLDQIPIEEQKREAMIAIDDIKTRIKRLLEAGGRSRLVQGYREQIEALEKRLEGTTAKSWDSLRQSLIGEYIEEVSPADFNSVMNDHLKRGKPIIWRGKKSEALYFCRHFGFSLPEFNRCFRPEDGKPFHGHNASKKDPSRQFLAILNNA